MQYIASDFEIFPSGVAETVPPGMPAEVQPSFLAQKKAESLLLERPDTLIIGCDTSVLVGNTILGKPKDEQEAFQMLRLLSGKEHRVITGCCLLLNQKKHTFHEETKVVFYPLTDMEIYDYISTGEPFDKAGAYGIQGAGCILVKKICGCYTNVVGLPVARLKREIAIFLENQSLS